jgi:hypothetical protein
MPNTYTEDITSDICDIHDLPLAAETIIGDDALARIMRRIGIDEEMSEPGTSVSAFNSSI